VRNYALRYCLPLRPFQRGSCRRSPGATTGEAQYQTRGPISADEVNVTPSISLSIDIFTWARYTPIGGQDTSKPLPYDPYDPISKQIQSSCRKSLSNLRTTYLDSYILHSPLPTIEQTLEAWHTLMQLQDEGTVRLIGVSNTYDVRILQALQKARKVQVVQNRWYEGNNWDQKVFNYCKELGIMYQYVISIPSSTKYSFGSVG